MLYPWLPTAVLLFGQACPGCSLDVRALIPGPARRETKMQTLLTMTWPEVPSHRAPGPRRNRRGTLKYGGLLAELRQVSTLTACCHPHFCQSGVCDESGTWPQLSVFWRGPTNLEATNLEG